MVPILQDLLPSPQHHMKAQCCCGVHAANAYGDVVHCPLSCAAALHPGWPAAFHPCCARLVHAAHPEGRTGTWLAGSKIRSLLRCRAPGGLRHSKDGRWQS